jgi:hypothetical protein
MTGSLLIKREDLLLTTMIMRLWLITTINIAKEFFGIFFVINFDNKLINFNED